MENKEEVIEEISDVSDSNEIKPSVNISDNVIKENEKKEEKNELVIEDVTQDSEVKVDDIDLDINNIPQEPIKTKNKTPIIVILSVLLIIDLALLAIYLIGVDNVVQIFM